MNLINLFCNFTLFLKIVNNSGVILIIDKKILICQSGCAEQVRFVRQSSCPVTENEKLVVKYSPGKPSYFSHNSY